MAVAKSTIINAPGNSTAGAIIYWSSLATDANNVYFDMNGKQGDRAIILVANINSTDVGTTAGLFFIGGSDSDAASTNFPYSASRLGKMQVSVHPPTASAKESLSPSTTAAVISIGVIGPFETARFKDTDGQIQFSKRKATSDLSHVKVAMILIP